MTEPDSSQRDTLARLMQKRAAPKDPVTGAAIGRDGRVPKHSFVSDPPIHPNMKRQTVGDLHPWAHGQALNDEPLQKSWEGKGNVPVHDAMANQQRSTDADDRLLGSHDPKLGNAILQEASRLGNPKGGRA